MILCKIFVLLPDESVDVWRPVEAERIAAGRFRIVKQPYDPEKERWEFEPGDEVMCDFVAFGGETFLAAIRRP